MTSGLTTVTATSALSRETPTKETPETAEMHVEKRPTHGPTATSTNLASYLR